MASHFADIPTWLLLLLLLLGFVLTARELLYGTPEATAAAPQRSAKSDSEQLAEILWLGDAPLFIDEPRVEAFYDAIIRPESEVVQEKRGQTETSSIKTVGGVELGAAAPGLTKFAVSGSQEQVREQGRAMEATLKPVSNPSRHLYKLVLHYAETSDFKSRLLLGGPDGVRDARGEPAAEWHKRNYTEKSPRALVLLDFPPGTTKLMPMAFELTDGGVVPIYKELGKRLGKEAKEKPPKYPKSNEPPAKRDEYFKWFADNFSSRIAMETLEDMVGDGKLAWLDIRVPFGQDPEVHLHLSLSPLGRYPSGVFAYQFIHRSTKHGVRIVGTLKSEPDVNVLAVFER